MQVALELVLHAGTELARYFSGQRFLGERGEPPTASPDRTPSAQVAAIRVLLRLDKEEAEQDAKTPVDDLYEFEGHFGAD